MKWNKRKTIHLLLDFIFICIFVFIDQLTKNIVVKTLKDKPAKIIIPNVFELNYLENRGAAFGMLQNQKILFVIIAAVMAIAILYILIKLPMEKKYLPIEVIMVFLLSGAAGNLIDRVKVNYVVDFFYFTLINFPIFNVADIYVSVSCVVLAIFILFYYKENDFDFFLAKGKKNKE